MRNADHCLLSIHYVAGTLLNALLLPSYPTFTSYLGGTVISILQVRKQP